MRLWFAFFFAAAAVAQSGATIEGRIAAAGVPLRGEVLAVTAAGAVRIARADADGQGHFRIEVAPGPVRIVARADGYVSEERPVVARAGDQNPAVQFNLSPAGSVSGRVFDETGAGAAGARVWVAYRGEQRRWRVGEETVAEAADAFGYFTLPAVAQGRPFVLHAEREGWLLASSGTLRLDAAEMKGVVLLLSRRGGAVRGTVVDAAGNPVPGARVRLRAIPAREQFTAEQRASLAYVRCTNRTAESDVGGSFVFAGVPAGRVIVTAHAGPRRAAAETTVTAGQEALIGMTLR